MKTASRFRPFLILLVIGLCLAHPFRGGAASPAPPGTTPAPSAVRSYAAPLSFEANQGQVASQVKYLARGQGYTLFLTPGAAMLGLRGRGATGSTSWLRMVLQGAAAAPAMAGEELLPGQSHYFVGNNPAQWRTHVPTFGRVRYEQIYPGVDLIYYGRQGRLENDFEVAPGSDPKVIAWRMDGAEAVRLTPQGDLLLSVAGNEVRWQRPRAIQQEGNKEREVPIRYRLQDRTVSFELGKYDPLRKLVIDPALTYSSYLGGSGGDIAYGVVLDAAGEAYLTGVTASTNFPVSSTGYQSTYAGSGDVFVTKFNATGTAVLFSTYLGGTGTDTPAQILLDASGDIFLVGSTSSNNFPTTLGAFQSVYSGNQDAFLTEMKPDGSALILSTYIGGSGQDFGTAVALDTAGNAYVTGSTLSTNFPTRNPLQLGNAGLSDAFVTEVSPVGALQYSTYLGGSLSDYGTGIAVDSAGNVYVSGYTYSSNFPTQSALQSTLGGASDIFLTKFTPGSSALLFSTYLGGSSIDQALAMVLDANGNVYLTGTTQSANFPVTSNAYQATLQGTANTFVAKVGLNGSVLVYSTLFGGNGTDQATALALDSAGNLYTTGFTQSPNFPLLDPFQKVLGLFGASNCGSSNLLNVPANTICADAFVAKFGPSGVPVFSSFLGGSGTDTGQGITVDSSGNVYVVGGTTSPNFPATAQSISNAPASTAFVPDTDGAYEWLYQGSSLFSNAFLAKITADDAPSVALSPQSINFGNQPLGVASNPVMVTLINEGSTALTLSSITASGDYTVTNSCGTSLPGGGGSCTFQVAFTPASLGLQTSQVTITEPVPGTSYVVTQAITLTGYGVLSGGSLLFNPTKLTFPATTVGSTSPVTQSALLINNGNQAVTITNISTSGNFAQTNNCGPNFPTVPATLNVGQACTIVVSFSPTGTGTVTGSVQVASNAASGTTSLGLSGTGTAQFSLSSNARQSIVLIGDNSATFTISVAAPSTFLTYVALACGSGATCNFNPATVPAGASSTLTVSGLSATSANPLNLTVNGTSAGQTASIALTVFFADFTVSASPSGTTVSAGNSATYSVTVFPTNNFNQTVLLSCPPAFPGIPVGTICYWNPPGLAFSGNNVSATSTLTITTTTQSGALRLPPPGRRPPGWGRWMLLLALLTFLAALASGWRRSRPWVRPSFRFALLAGALIMASVGVGCENYVNPININPEVNGTPSGTYSIVLRGTLGNNSGVTRTTTVNLSVLPTS